MTGSADLQCSLEANVANVKQRTGGSDDLVVRDIRIGAEDAGIDFAIVYFEGLTEEKSINQFIIEPLMNFGTNQGERICAS